MPGAPRRVDALAAGRIPVVAPLAAAPSTSTPTRRRGARRRARRRAHPFLTDVPGLLLDGAVVPSIEADEADRLLDGGELEGGIVPKLRPPSGRALGVRAEIGETAVLA